MLPVSERIKDFTSLSAPDWYRLLGRIMHVWLLLLLLHSSAVFLCYCPLLLAAGHVYPDEVVVKILGGPLHAKLVANRMGYSFHGPVRGFEDTYLLLPLISYDNHNNYRKRASTLRKRLEDDDQILWAEELQPKTRQKRDLLADNDIPFIHQFNDELWDQQWYLQDTRTRPDLPKLDLNVLPLYQLGVTGRNVRVAILDDGVEHTHQDLQANYAPEISYDCNEDDADPMPRPADDAAAKSNSHGTRCAGEVAMIANNGKCGVGIAYGAKIGGVKLLDGPINDRVEGMALSHARHLVDIYSASWGPTDDGMTVDGPGRLAQEALERGIREGRNGKGSIFVWASGNGGSQGDNCNCDGYLTSPYTISIGSASQRGEFPWYGEPCASTLAVTYSSGAYHDQMIATTDLRNECTIKHTGTSASAPLAAGIIALALEVNPELTWRDIQHLIVWTSDAGPVADDPDWTRNAAGLWTSTRFGFGLMNALSLVTTAANWTRVPASYVCVERPLQKHGQRQTIAHRRPLSIPIKTSGCAGSDNEITYLEHVQVQIDISYTIRGALEIYLTSPAGTKAKLLDIRRLDTSQNGFHQWKFASVMTWGEYADGLWLLEIQDNVGPSANHGHASNVSLILHGTREQPVHMENAPGIFNRGLQ